MRIFLIALLAAISYAQTDSCTWQHTANAAIYGKHDQKLTSVTIDECKDVCCALPDCKSFDYYKNSNECDLSNSSASDVGGLKTDYDGNPYDHYALLNTDDSTSAIPQETSAVPLATNWEMKDGKRLFSASATYKTAVCESCKTGCEVNDGIPECDTTSNAEIKQFATKCQTECKDDPNCFSFGLGVWHSMYGNLYCYNYGKGGDWQDDPTMPFAGTKSADRDSRCDTLSCHGCIGWQGRCNSNSEQQCEAAFHRGAVWCGANPTKEPTYMPTTNPSKSPSAKPMKEPTLTPSANPTKEPTANPSHMPTTDPSTSPSAKPTKEPTSTPLAAASVPAHFALIDGAPESGLNLTEVTNPDPTENLGEVQCCKTDGTCTRRSPWDSDSNNDCISGDNNNSKYSLQEAANMCAALGEAWSLCTRQQVDHGNCQNKGCNIDHAYTWVIDNESWTIVETSGGSPAYEEGRDYFNAWDGDVATFYDYYTGNGGYTQATFSCTVGITRIEYWPRDGYVHRMVNGRFLCVLAHGSEIELGIITDAPNEGQWTALSDFDEQACVGLRYIGPLNSYGNVAEIKVTGECVSTNDLLDDTTPSTRVTLFEGPSMTGNSYIFDEPGNYCGRLNDFPHDVISSVQVGSDVTLHAFHSCPDEPLSPNSRCYVTTDWCEGRWGTYPSEVFTNGVFNLADYQFGNVLSQIIITRNDCLLEINLQESEVSKHCAGDALMSSWNNFGFQSSTEDCAQMCLNSFSGGCRFVTYRLDNSACTGFDSCIYRDDPQNREYDIYEVSCTSPSSSPSSDPTYQPSETPTGYPSIETTHSPSMHPTQNPTYSPLMRLIDPTIASFPSKNPSTQTTPGICADEKGAALQGWENCVESSATCFEWCDNLEDCYGFSFSSVKVGCNNILSTEVRSHTVRCILHERIFNVFNPPKAIGSSDWVIFSGSDNVPMDGLTYTTLTDRPTMRCRSFPAPLLIIATENILPFTKDWIVILVCMFLLIILYYVLVYFCYECHKNESINTDVAQIVDLTDEIPNTPLELASIDLPTMTVGSLHVGEGYWGIIWDEGFFSTLFPTLHENTVEKRGCKLFCSWFLRLSCGQKFAIFMNIIDILTDALFVISILDSNVEIAYILSVSVLGSTASFLTMLSLSISLFAESPLDLQTQRILRLRWGILIFVPLEDLVTITAIIYIFIRDGGNFLAFLSIVVSILSIIFLHFLNVAFEKSGVNDIIAKRATMELVSLPHPECTGSDEGIGGEITLTPPCKIEIEDLAELGEGDLPSPILSNFMTPNDTVYR